MERDNKVTHDTPVHRDAIGTRSMNALNLGWQIFDDLLILFFYYKIKFFYS